MTPYYACKRMYHSLIPKSARNKLFWSMPDPLRKLRGRLIAALESTARHDEIYDANYYSELVDPAWDHAPDTITEAIVQDLAPQSVIDVGCGSGKLLLSLRQRGVSGFGFDCAEAALQLCRSRGLSVAYLDLENDPIPTARADLVISTEVAEHLPASCADRFVQVLTSMAPHLVLTASLPGSVIGTDHINEQPNEYWIEKVESHNFVFDRELSMRWRREWRERGVAHCFASTVMVFRRSVQAN